MFQFPIGHWIVLTGIPCSILNTKYNFTHHVHATHFTTAKFSGLYLANTEGNLITIAHDRGGKSRETLCLIHTHRNVSLFFYEQKSVLPESLNVIEMKF